MMNDLPFALEGRKVWVAGHTGMVGAAIMGRLAAENCNILTVPHRDLDLRRQGEVESWMAAEKPDVIFLAAATVGGILANDTRPAEFIYDNLIIEANVIHAAWTNQVKKLLFLGSSCIYPRLAPQPMKEDALLGGPLEPTNQWYAMAKISGIKLCQAFRRQYGCDFISAQPTNLYGPHDTYDLQGSHVIPAMIMKVHGAKESSSESVEIWGTGQPRREFLYVDDLADALIFMMKNTSEETHINVGTGEDVTISELAETIARVVGFKGRFDYNTDKPDGAPRKLLDVGLLEGLGWTAQTGLEEGLGKAYQWYLDNVVQGGKTA